MWPVSVNVCVSVYLFTLESGHHRAKEAVPVGEVCNSSLRRSRENKHALTHTCWQWRVINIWAKDVFGLREEGRVAWGTCTGQPSPESPVAASFPFLPRRRTILLAAFLMVIFWTVFPISERPSCIWFLTLRLTSQPFIPLRVCHQLWQNATPCH